MQICYSWELEKYLQPFGLKNGGAHFYGVDVKLKAELINTNDEKPFNSYTFLFFFF